MILLETKRRLEECDIDVTIPGYSVHEALRSNVAEDKDGGGIALYTKLSDGLMFKRHTPDINQSSKTAVCGVYLG